MEEKNLIEKIAYAMNNCGGVGKKGKNEMQGYKYVKAADVMKEFRHELFSRGVVIVPDELEYQERQFQTGYGEKVKNATEGKITIEYDITDGKQSKKVRAFGVGRDFSDKAIYKAKTGAQKYLLRQLGLMPDEADDPETTHIEEAHSEEESHLQRLGFADQRIGSSEAILFMNLAKKNNRTAKEINEFLSELGCKQATEMKNKDYNRSMKWADTPPDDLVAITEASIAHVKREKRADGGWKQEVVNEQ